MDPVTRIETFSQIRSDRIQRKSFLKIDTEGPYTYFLSPNRRAVSLFAERINNPELSRKFLTVVLRSSRLIPQVLQYAPGVQTVEISVPANESFEFGIVSPRLLTLLAPKAGSVSKIGWENDERLRPELDIRQRLPESINTPQILEIDKKFPYFVTQYVEGRSLENPVENWDHLLNALCQLEDWYNSSETTWVSREAAIEELENELSGLKNDEVIKTSLERLRESSLPEQLSRGTVHGDLHDDNILVSDDTVYIIDWEGTKNEYLLYDFLYPFLRFRRRNGRSEIFDQLMNERADGGRIGRAYADRCGSTVWGSSDWFPQLVLFGLLRETARRPRTETKWKTAYECLQELRMD